MRINEIVFIPHDILYARRIRHKGILIRFRDSSVIEIELDSPAAVLANLELIEREMCYGNKD